MSVDFNTRFSLYQSVTRSNTFNSTCTSSCADVEWRFSQAFGDDNSSEDDLITAVEFDPSGNYVTVGDKAGRLCIFEASSGGLTHRSYVTDHLNHDSGMVSTAPRQTRVKKPLHEYVDSDEYQDILAQEQHTQFQVPGWDELDIDVEHLSSYAKYIKHRVSNGIMTKTIGQHPPTTLPNNQTVQSTLPKQLEYKFYTEFQSHDVEFDCLKSSDIPSTINVIKFVESTPTNQSILATNDKTIKLWNLCDKNIKSEAPNGPTGGVGTFVAPQLVPIQTVTLALRRGLYNNAHTYHINSLSPSCNGNNFLSSDDIRILFWDYEYPMQPFNIVDLRPPQLEEITEVVTSTTFHPSSADLMCYATSRGCIKLCDLRVNALCDQSLLHTRSFDLDEDPTTKSFFSEIVSSISDVKFTKSGQYIISRDFLHVYIWDSRNESRPIAVFNVHDHLRNNLSDLYEFDALFDSFKVDASPDGLQVVTGSFHNNFSIHNWLNGGTLNFEAGSRVPRRKHKNVRRKAPSAVQSQSGPTGTTGGNPDENGKETNSMNVSTAGPNSVPELTPQTTPTFQHGQNPVGSLGPNVQLKGSTNRFDRNENVNISLINFGRKALHTAWHPSLDCVAVAGVNKLYIYQAFPPQIDDVL